jgi:rhomboid protease GluP
MPAGEILEQANTAIEASATFPVNFTRGWSTRGNRPQNSYNLGGKGEVTFDATTFRFKGKDVDVLWGGKYKEYAFSLTALRNASCEELKISVEIPTESADKRPYTARVVFWAKDAESAAQIFARMPKTQTEEFATRKREEAEFNERLARATPRVFVTPALVAINIAIFIAMAFAGAGVMVAQGDVHFKWGSNFGLITAAGEWWRLFTSMFLHFGFMHLALNMAVLWGIGATTERLYGNGYFLLIYILSGMAGALASLLWHPEINSAGASGAVFGVFGASLAYFLQPGNGVPRTVVSGNIVAGLFLVGVNLLFGLAPGIDNMAHLGGLVAGFVLGHGLARPLEPEVRVFRARNMAVSGAILAALAALLVLPVEKAVENSRAELRMRAELKAFLEGEKAALAAAKDIFAAAKARTLDRSAEADRIQEEVVKRYEEGYRSVSDVPLGKESPQFAIQQRVMRIADNRRQAYRMMADAIRANDIGAFRKSEELLKEGDRIIRESAGKPK